MVTYGELLSCGELLSYGDMVRYRELQSTEGANDAFNELFPLSE